MRIDPFGATAPASAPLPTLTVATAKKPRARKAAEPAAPRVELAPMPTATSPGVLGNAFRIPDATFAALHGTPGDAKAGATAKARFIDWLRANPSAFDDWRHAWREYSAKVIPFTEPSEPPAEIIVNPPPYPVPPLPPVPPAPPEPATTGFTFLTL